MIANRLTLWQSMLCQDLYTSVVKSTWKMQHELVRIHPYTQWAAGFISVQIHLLS